jgi:hypothetical protein
MGNMRETGAKSAFVLPPAQYQDVPDEREVSCKAI